MDNIKKFFEFYDYQINHLKKEMPGKKVKHSKRVAKLTKYFTESEDIYNAALYHDYIERGGDLTQLKSVLSFHSYNLVIALTKTEDIAGSKNQSLDILKERFPKYTQDFKNDVILIKICDRADNLVNKYKKGELRKKYIKKSSALIKFLYDNYTGDKSKIDNFLKEKIFEGIPEIKKKKFLNGYV